MLFYSILTAYLYPQKPHILDQLEQIVTNGPKTPPKTRAKLQTNLSTVIGCYQLWLKKGYTAYYWGLIVLAVSFWLFLFQFSESIK